MMTAHEILFARSGENATTSPDPVAVWVGQVDLATTDMYCVSSDMDMLVSCTKYSVHTVMLPEWLSPEEWVRSSIKWKYTWGMGVDPSWSEEIQRALLKMSAAERLACVKLLKTKKFRSAFRQSLATQLQVWIAGERKFASPFSDRQWECLIDQYIAREAKGLEEGLYRSRGLLSGAPVTTLKAA